MAASLSVIVPFFDELEYLDAAVSSIFAQSISDIEVIVVGDNPLIDPSDALKSRARAPSLKILGHSENLGLSAARNTGLSNASGDWIAFLDADDYYLHGGLAAHLEYAQSTGADITHAQAMRSAVGTPDAAVIRWDRQLHSKKRHGGDLNAFPEAQFIASSWSSLYRRDFFERTNLQFDPAQRQFEDRLFVIDSVTQAHSLAFLGEPTRVWRGRRASISSKKTDEQTRLLQITLLEKCLSVAEKAVEDRGADIGVLHRESVNTLWRLIWDLDVLDTVAAGPSEEAAHLQDRLEALMPRLVLPQYAEKDRVLRRVSRVGHHTRRGVIGKDAYRKIVADLKGSRFEPAFQKIAGAKSQASPRKTDLGGQKRLILHLGLHKTGSTYIQHRLAAGREALSEHGVLVPQTGMDPEQAAVIRPDAHSGHSALFRAIRTQKMEIFQDLKAEIAASPCDTVLLSCENMLFPYLSRREVSLNALFAQLGGFREVQVVAFARRPDSWLDAYYREWVLNGARGGARGFDSFARDYAPLLLNWPELFGLFETFSGQPVRLMDYDAHARTQTLWQGFLDLCGLPPALSVLEGTRDAKLYPTPNRTDVAVAELIAALEPRTARRVQLLTAYFAQSDIVPDDQAICDPATRKSQLAMFEQLSGPFAKERGYDFDMADWEQTLDDDVWTPPGALDAVTVQRLSRAGLSLAEENSNLTRMLNQPRKKRLKLRPWVVRLIDRMKDQ